ncbi:Putative glutathione S-transferase, Thioredoxin-like superfamily [Septoria linicola]|uniref:Glutathione S-transferase, Thioredoxin-like superfamily n=1 Tax=Septoria linicola TaxID=215465 RepID=A0A9Q9ASZ3_9PEZI|nr:putative glutathione S-transferase, Thioredoxin-like superfamily [Septoria linicola]USW52628.1 Putative glutathione S-transferase, Thioredoxin-like superfamily [Septoria linicola]
MSGIKTPNDIVLFHYRASPYGRRVTAYLALRNIQYAECLQPPILPRPDMEALGVKYRRSPVMAIGRSIYVDTRITISKLEELFPASSEHPGLSTPETAGLAALLQKFAVDGSVFKKVVTQIPQNLPMLKDPKFQKDRAEFRDADQKRNPHLVKPEGTVHLRQCFDIVEALLVDDRKWIGNTEELSLADLEGAWAIDWFLGDLMPDQAYFSEKQYPKVHAWRTRYRDAVQAATKRAQKPLRLQGDQAVEAVTSSAFLDRNLEVDAQDPLKLTKGDSVKVFPLDGGGSHQDQGRLVKLTKDEVAVAVQARSGAEIHVHAPRWAFRIEGTRDGARL